jgi:methyl-accepting chemotaxis protein
VNQMDRITQQNAAMSEEATAASRSLAEESEQLRRLIGEFQVAGASDDAAMRRELRRVAPHAFKDAKGNPRGPNSGRPRAISA